MSHVRYGLLCFGKAKKGKINEIDRHINRAIRCFHFKNLKENVRKVKIKQKILFIQNMLKCDLILLCTNSKEIYYQLL